MYLPWQESILQKVVMTAFADRTVVTIAVSKVAPPCLHLRHRLPLTVLSPPAAPRPHHPECRPGDCDEARDHPGARPARGPAGEGGQRLHLLRASRQVAQDVVEGRHFKVQLSDGIYKYSVYFVFMLYYICTLKSNSLLIKHNLSLTAVVCRALVRSSSLEALRWKQS